jgi:hypothetical protein
MADHDADQRLIRVLLANRCDIPKPIPHSKPDGLEVPDSFPDITISGTVI